MSSTALSGTTDRLRPAVVFVVLRWFAHAASPVTLDLA